MATLDEIAESIQSLDSKKQSLKEAFEDLQKHSHSLSSFTLSWPQIDSHFSQIQSSLQSRLSTLQQKERSLPKSKQNPENPFPQNPQIKSFCEKMEFKNLRNWVRVNLKLKDPDFSELGKALKFAPDPFKLVLDATEGFHPRGRISMILLEGLMGVKGSVGVSEELRGRAKSFALEWKGDLNEDGKYPFEIVGLLYLLGCFGLVEDIGVSDVLELVCMVAKNSKRGIDMCRVLGLEDKVPDLIRKLIKNDMQLVAFKFVYEFKLLDQFPPVDLLKSYLNNARKCAQQLCKKGKDQPKAMGQGNLRERNALKTVLKYVKDYKLASEYPPERIEKQLKELQKQKAKMKSIVAKQPSKPTPPKPKKKSKEKRKVPKLQVQKKRKRSDAFAASTSVKAPGIASSAGVNAYPLPQQHYLQSSVPGLGSSVRSYPLSGSMLNDPYGLASTLVNYASSLSSGGSHLHGLGLQLPSSSYQVPNQLDAYGFPPHHHPTYHPQ